MTDLPTGWEWTTIGEIAATSLGKMLDKKQATGLHPTPYLRNINVRWGTFDLSDVAEMDIRPEELDRVLARPGDVIACEGGEPGRAAVWRGPGTVALQKALHRIQPAFGVVPGYLALLLQHLANSRELVPLFTGTTIKHLPQEKLRLIPVPLPPQREQERIVAAVEEHLSRLDAVETSVSSARRRLALVRLSIAESLIESLGPLAPIAHFASEEKNALAIGPFGSNLKVSDYCECGVPLVFVRDIRRGIFGGPGTRFVSQEKAESLSSHIVRSGDVVVTKMGDPPGDAAVYTGKDAIVTADCIKLTPAAGVDASFVAAALGTRRARGDVLAVTKGVAQKKVSLARFKSAVFLPKPDLDVQAEIASKLADLNFGLDRLAREIEVAESRAGSLRRSILAAAFSGQLVPQDPDDETASALLERIQSERDAATPAKRTRKSTASCATSS